MWFEDRSVSNIKMSSIVEEWRDLWSFKAEFMLVGLSYLFATTNLLNLPRLILDNGGLAFVAAYSAAILAVVLPIVLLELSIGQLTGRGPVQALYNICPIFKGVGVSQIFVSFITVVCFARYLAWLLLYLFHLFWTVLDERPGLPWINCQNFPELQATPCIEPTVIANASTDFGQTVRLSTLRESSALVHFMGALENPSNSIIEIGQIQLYLLIAQGIVWILVFSAICFGVRWLGKVTVFTFMTPLCLILILLARILFLNGAIPMFERLYYITDWNRLADYNVWKLAVEQAIVASGVGFGVFITIGSYNKRTNNVVRDSIFIIIGHFFLTAIQLSTIFGLVGYLSYKTNLVPLEILGNGQEQMWHLLVYLSFVPSTKLFTGILLFLSIFVLLNICYLLALNILATFEDALGEKWSRCFPRFVLALFISLLGAGVGVFFATQAGKHAYVLTTGYLKYVTIWIILAAELLAVAWFYCAHSLGRDMKTMVRSACCWCLGYFILFFTYLLPAVPIVIAVLNILGYDYNDFPEQIRNWEWSEYVGFAIALIPLLPIPIFILFTICYNCSDHSDLTRCQKLRQSFRSPLDVEGMKQREELLAHSDPHDNRYAHTPQGYTLLPQAPLAEPEAYNDLYGNNPNVRNIPIVSHAR
ncbi:unnamed protein product [Bursaphelenchus xylophilus]|uniref:(pine wood nematode) hypothetical protein n=1 Tax=Bursaphelenchus xylophilus TaxID=6326 RepID=A0A1I7SA78_BURXY|nr:unnamed protein product [Bursaphelenchus xylophilus]CAG9084203.1 unnamed protein product [Bursaphelenchus xylophilus]